MRRIFIFIALLHVLTHSSKAITIPIHLGPIGPVNDLRISFPELVGLPLAGQTLSLDFVFQSGQFIRYWTDTRGMIAFVILQTDVSSSPPFASGSGYLGAADGSALQAPVPGGGVTSSAGWMAVGIHPFHYGLNTLPIDFARVHFDVTLPVAARFISSSDLRFAGGGFFGVGPGVAVDMVPDAGSTLWLLAVGVASAIAADKLLRARRSRLKVVLAVAGQ